ncbi:MAG: hypothetical protein J5883_04825 [Clostridiales bacterium]|nr:hypothetical protein [Clostridiales bacterium]
MKKLLSVILCIPVFLLTGCNVGGGVNEVLQSGMAQADGETVVTSAQRQAGVDDGAPTPAPVEGAAAALTGENGIDVDLTVLSSTMVYSQVYCMLISPDAYLDMTVRMNGAYAFYHDDQTGRNYYACIVSDATACCSQGIEFIPGDDYTYPDDFPQPGDEICVTGVFSTYEENGYTYCTLKDAEFETSPS